MHRRTFLGAGVALPALGLPSPKASPARHSSLDPWVEVHAGHLRANAAAVYKLAGVPILAVIKNNGYGAGVTNVALALQPLDQVYGFAVVKMQEALALRDDGIRKPILLMGPVAGTDFAELSRRNITLMVYTPVRSALERAAAQSGQATTVHVCVDTGLGRVGVPYRQAFDLIRDLAGARGVRIGGIMMTFTEDEAFDGEQLRRFRALSAQIE